jgi:hypothetical protein
MTEQGPAQVGSVVRQLLDESGCVCTPIELDVENKLWMQHHSICPRSSEAAFVGRLTED